MTTPVTVELEEPDRQALENEADKQGLSLEAYLAAVLRSAARRSRHRDVRLQSKKVAEYLESCPEAQRFYDDWGTPTADLDA